MNAQSSIELTESSSLENPAANSGPKHCRIDPQENFMAFLREGFGEYCMTNRNYSKAMRLFLGLGLAATVAACASGEPSNTEPEGEAPAVVEPVPEAPATSSPDSTAPMNEETAEPIAPNPTEPDTPSNESTAPNTATPAATPESNDEGGEGGES